MSSFNDTPLDFISDMDIVGPVCVFYKNKLLGEEEWVDCIERLRRIYSKTFHRGGWADKRNVLAWENLIFDQNESWDDFDLRFKFVQFLEMYPVGGGARESKTALYWQSKKRSRETLARAVMHDIVYGLRIYRSEKI